MAETPSLPSGPSVEGGHYKSGETGALADSWRKLFRRAMCEANGLTNYVDDDRPELRRAEKNLDALEEMARALDFAPSGAAWPKTRDVARCGDMAPPECSHLRVLFDNDNDVVVSVWQDDGASEYGHSASIEFCNGGGGGGGSMRTRMALVALMVAMEADNSESPHKQWPPQRQRPVEPKPLHEALGSNDPSASSKDSSQGASHTQGPK